MKFIIDSYVLKPEIKKIKPNDPNLSNYFIPIGDIKKGGMDKKKMNPMEIDGYIYISYDGTNVIMNAKYWDSISYLWVYLLNLIEDFFETGDAKVYFPDQPVKVSLKNINRMNVEFCLENKRWILPKKVFLTSMLNAAEDYFGTIGIFLSTGIFAEQISQIKKLRMHVNEDYK